MGFRYAAKVPVLIVIAVAPIWALADVPLPPERPGKAVERPAIALPVARPVPDAKIPAATKPGGAKSAGRPATAPKGGDADRATKDAGSASAERGIVVPPVKPGASTLARTARKAADIGAARPATPSAPKKGVTPPKDVTPPEEDQFIAIPPAIIASTENTIPLPPVKPEPPIRKAMVTSPSAGALICGDPRLTGKPRATVVGHIPGCTIGQPVVITKISGIKLSTPATLDCHTARTFANWLTGVAVPSARKILGRRITGVWVMGSYSCRTRNNRRGARLSEHAGGRAIDIGGVTLGDGRKVRVLQDWGKGNKGTFLRRIWKSACGPFKTVLGPDGDRFHQDHLHFDTARRRSTFCR